MSANHGASSSTNEDLMPVLRPRKRSWQAMNEGTGPPVMLNPGGTRQRAWTDRVHQSTDSEDVRIDIDFNQIFKEGWENEENGSEDENEDREGAEKDRDEDEEDKDEEDVDDKDDTDMDEDDRDDEDQDNDMDQEDRDDEDEEDKEDKEGKEGKDNEGDEEDDVEMNEHGEDRADDEDNDEEEQQQERSHLNIPDSHRSSRKHRDKGKRRGNIFIDDEADGGETSEASDVDDKGPSPFIDDGEHTDSEREPDEEFNVNYLQNGRPEDQQYYWDKLLDRAYNRVKGGERWTRAIGMEADVEDDDKYTITAQDLLWVVPCMEGHEEDAVFTILDCATNPTSPKSAMFNASHPRRIFIEAPNATIARAAVDSIPGLFPSRLNLVPYSEREHCVSHTPRRMPLWVRIHGSRAKWRAVNGTVGIMVPLLNNYDVPETWTVVVASKDPLEASAPWIWEAVNISDIRFKINPDELPTVRDIQKFVGCDLLNEYTLKVLFKRIYRTNLRPGARVCITSGEFVGLIGEVVASVGAAATVRLGNGAVEPIPLDVLRRVFVIGDQVMIATLPWRGVTGWVVSTEADHVTIWSDLQQKEYRVNSLEVEFFSPSFHQAFLLPPQIKRPNISMFDIYQRFKGRTVYVTGHHPFKGQRGTIKDTHPDGRVWIQMESMLSGNQPTVFKHTDLALIDDKTEQHLLPLSSKDIATTCNAVPFADARQSSTARTSYEGTNPDSQLALIEDLPVVDDTISFPESDPIEPAPNVDPYWLVEACFQHRIKLAHINDPNHIVQLMGRGSGLGLVQVCDRMQVRELASHMLTALLPSRKDDVVVVLAGEHVGKMFKVVEVHETHSQVKKPGRVLKKNEVDPSFSNDILVHAFGPLNR